MQQKMTSWLRVLVIFSLCCTTSWPGKHKEAGKKKKAKRTLTQVQKQDETSSPAPRPDIGEDVIAWHDQAGNKLVEGRFWCVKNGIIAIKDIASGKIVNIDARRLHPRDLAKLVLNSHSVLNQTSALISSSLLRTTTGEIVQRTSSHHQVAVQWVKPEHGDLWRVRIRDRSFLVHTSANLISRKTAGKTMTMYARAGGGKLLLPSGEELLVIELASPMPEKQAMGLLKKDPLLFARYLNGSSTRYRIWLETQKKLNNAEEYAKRQQMLRARKEQATLEKRQQATIEAKVAEKKQLLEKLAREAENYETRIKQLESNIRQWELAKKHHKVYSKHWNNLRSKIKRAEEEKLRIQKAIRELNKQKEETERDIAALRIKE
ncbi:MAG: hypothetical protein D6820_12475 [Lentisphaerae bacterium]|nr:MAG: hypothetical protein D6820_12475 [Lentisphaerota bacterium]